MRPAGLPPIGYSHRRLTFDEVHSIVVAGLIPEPNSGCMLWDGCCSRFPSNPQIYGMIKLDGKMVKTHRVAYQAAHGPIPAGMQVLHRCDVGLCCNPAHLYLGTNSENHADKAEKDRGRKRLTHTKAMEIHRMVRSGMTHQKVADAFGVRQSTVSRIIRGERRPASSVGI